MRIWAWVIPHDVRRITFYLCTVFLLTACGGGTDPQSSSSNANQNMAGSKLPTADLSEAEILDVRLPDSTRPSEQEAASQKSEIPGLGEARGTVSSVTTPTTTNAGGTNSDGVRLEISVTATEQTADSINTPAADIEPPETASAGSGAGSSQSTPVDAPVTDNAPTTTQESAVTEGEPSTTEGSSVPDGTPVEIPATKESAAPEGTPVEIPTTDDSGLPETEESIAETPTSESTDPDSTPPTHIPDASEEPVAIVIGSNVGDVIKILSDLETSVAQTNVQQTPVATADGYLYTANIEHGPRGDASGFDLKTVVRQGTQNTDGTWSWNSAVVEDRTVHNKWHTAPSIEVDKSGQIHVAYNLHNFPWQYKRTTSAHDLNSFNFYGQAVSNEEIRISHEENKTSFPTLGKADIPGNQITYPAFFKDRNEDLYVTYRFAGRPGQSFSNRTMSSGVSVYNSATESWSAIGGEISLGSADYQYDAEAHTSSIAIASKQGWTSYHPRLVFDQSNKMYVNWFWRSGVAGAVLSRPCMVSTYDRLSFTDSMNNPISLPVQPEDCGNLGDADSREFYSVGNTAINSSGEMHILLSPGDGGREIVYQDSSTGTWMRESAPYNATEIFFDADDTMWAIASGIRILMRPANAVNWSIVYDDSSANNCYPKATLSEDMKVAFIHAESCSGGSISLFGLQLDD